MLRIMDDANIFEDFLNDADANWNNAVPVSPSDEAVEEENESTDLTSPAPKPAQSGMEVHGNVPGQKPPTPIINVFVSNDKLKAHLTIAQIPPVPYQVTVDDIYEALAKAKVEFGVMLEKIDQIVANQEYPVQELIAVGKDMVPPIDAQLEYLFSVAGGGRPKDMGHYVDHYNLNLVENVTAGQVLVRKTPTQAGEAGMSVLGQPLKVANPKDMRLPVGKGTKIADDNPNELVAEFDGFVRLDTQSFNRIVVENIFTVKQNVDLSTGNLNIEGSVRILGNVREGFSVTATGNIQVAGFLEAARLEAGGNIEVTGGIVGGKNRANLTAKQNIIVKFADNAVMSAGNNIVVADEVISCDLRAEQDIVVGQGAKSGKSAGAIIGGVVVAGHEIRAVSIGSEAGTLTRLQLGEEAELVQRRRNMQADLKKSRDDLAETQKVIASLNKRIEERAPGRQNRLTQKQALTRQKDDTYNHMRSILTQAEREGHVTSTSQIEGLESAIAESRATLARVRHSIDTLNERINKKVSIADVMKNKKTLDQFQAAENNIFTKLRELEEQLEQRKVNPWGNLPWATRREVEQLQAQIGTIQTHLAAVELEDSTDEKLQTALAQLEESAAESSREIAWKEEELEAVKQELAVRAAQIPRLVVYDKLYAGTEVIIRNRRRRFTRTPHRRQS
jgi:uncharacterized protein (DUF342 family)